MQTSTQGLNYIIKIIVYDYNKIMHCMRMLIPYLLFILIVFTAVYQLFCKQRDSKNEKKSPLFDDIYHPCGEKLKQAIAATLTWFIPIARDGTCCAIAASRSASKTKTLKQ